jgi:hypothetical protein
VITPHEWVCVVSLLNHTRTPSITQPTLQKRYQRRIHEASHTRMEWKQGLSQCSDPSIKALPVPSSSGWPQRRGSAFTVEMAGPCKW